MIKKIVLTGGPGGGKTTCLPHITKHLRDLGFHVMVVPEVATILIPGCDLHLPTMSEDQRLQFSFEFIRLQTAFEDSYVKLANSLANENTVIICDRGCLDTFAFCTEEMCAKIMAETQHSKTSLTHRYDAVIHLATAADGAEEHYTLENNSARTETPEQARDVCWKLRDAWVGHSKVYFVKNGSGGFEEKIQKTKSILSDIVGVTMGQEIERKFLISDDMPVEYKQGHLPVKHESTVIVQHYLTKIGNKIDRIRKTGIAGQYYYTFTSKSDNSDGIRDEKEYQIPFDDYYNLLSNSIDGNRKPITKIRKSFMHEGQKLELDFICDPKKITLLEIEVDNLEEDVHIPDWLPVVREVTSEKAYYNSEISKGS